MQIVEVGEGARQLLVDELQRTPHRLDADLDENPWRLLDVVARRLDQARRLTKLRQDAARALGGGRVREEGLAGEARGEEGGVELRGGLPGAERLELEHPSLQVGREHLVFELLDRGQAAAIDLVEAAKISGEGVRLAIDRVRPAVPEQIVVRAHAIERGVRRMCLVKIPEQIVDEMG